MDASNNEIKMESTAVPVAVCEIGSSNAVVDHQVVPSNLELITDNSKPEEDSFYTDAAKYWAEIPPTVDGMLGGFGFVSHTDIQGSDSFLTQIYKLKHPPRRIRALDCGAGIGRVTKLLLQRHFSTVDLVEQNPAFLAEAKAYLGPSKKIGQLFCSGLQNFCPEEGAYDVIWVQWVLGHLTDEHFANFFKSCVRGLRENGLIVVKENVTSSGVDEEDAEDSSVTRCEARLVSLLEGPACLRILRQMKQHKFPKGLYPVHMYALRSQKSPLVKQSNTNKVTTTQSSKIEIKNVDVLEEKISNLEVAMDTEQSNQFVALENKEVSMDTSENHETVDQTKEIIKHEIDENKICVQENTSPQLKENVDTQKIDKNNLETCAMSTSSDQANAESLKISEEVLNNQ